MTSPDNGTGPRKFGPGDLREAGLALFGDGPGWQSRMAEFMGHDRASISRWASGAVRVPRHAELLIRYALRYGLMTGESQGPDGPAPSSGSRNRPIS